MRATSVAVLAGALAVPDAGADPSVANGSQARRPLSVTDCIEAKNILSFSNEAPRTRNPHDILAPPTISVSPDGRRFLVMLSRGDLHRNGEWVEVIAGRTDSLAAAAGLETVAQLFTTSKRDQDTGRLPPTYPRLNRIVWLSDNERVAFLWNDGESPTQVITVNVRTRRMESLARHPTSIFRFGINGDGTRVVYLAFPDLSESRAKAAERLRDGFVVSSINLSALLRGQLDAWDPWQNWQYFVAMPLPAAPRRVSSGGVPFNADWPSRFSPDHRYAIVMNERVAELPTEWQKYTDPSLQAALTVNRQRQIRPEGTWDSSGANRLMHVGVIDIEQAVLRPLWNAPNNPGVEMDLVWSPDSRSVIVGPTFLPVDQADDAGLAGMAVAEVDIATGRIRRLPLPASVRGSVRPLS